MSHRLSPVNRALGLAAVVLVAGLAITAASFTAARASEQRAAAQGLRSRSDLTGETVTAEILRYQETLTMVAAALSAQPDLESSGFEQLTRPLLDARLRGAAGLAFIVPGTDRNTSKVQAYWREHGVPGLTLDRAGSGTHAYSVFGRSLDGRDLRVGRDLAATSQLADTLAITQGHGVAMASEPYVLLKDRQLAAKDRQLSLVLAARVFDPSNTRPRGWVILGLRSGDLLTQVLRQTGHDINATLTTPQYGGKPLTLVRYVSGPATDPALIQSITIPVGQREWTLTVWGTDAAAARDSDGGALARGTFWGGIVITVLLSGLILVLTTSRQRALIAVGRATAGLREADQRFRFAFERAHAGMALIHLGADEPGRFLQVNEALCTMLGYTDADLLQRTVLDITHPEDRDHDHALIVALSQGQQTVAAVSEKRYLHADGHFIWAMINGKIITGTDGRPTYWVVQIEDVTSRRAENERLSAMALQDPLTGLGNRLLFEDRMTQAIARAARSQQRLSVIFCDLDLFKAVNDTHGHAAGDAVLRAVAARLREAVRPADTVARLGGDEFVVLCEELADPAATELVISRLQSALDAPIQLPNGSLIQIRCSFGSASAQGGVADIDALLHEADLAMYNNKNQARWASV